VGRLSAPDAGGAATPIAGRGQAAIDPLVGMFVNTLVLRSQVDPGAGFAELLDQVRAADLDAFANSDVPFETLVGALDPVRSEAFAPLAQVMLSFDPASSAASAPVEVAGLSLAQVDPPVVPAQFDLTFTISTAPAGQGWSGTVIYATDLFDEATAASMADRFVEVLAQGLATSERAVGELDVVDAEQRAELLAFGRGPVRAVPAELIPEAIAAQAASSANTPALEFEGRSVSFAEFGARVATLARALIEAGVGPDTAVGVCMDRSVELMVAVHAVMAAGGQYVPVDPGTPSGRAHAMLTTAGARLVLVVRDAAPSAVSGLDDVETLDVDAASSVDVTTAPITDADRLAPLRPENAAYTLFTSGSTGVPKGVTVSHEALRNRLLWMRDDYRITARDRFLLKTPYTFDVSVWELFLPSLVGAPLVIARPDGHRDPVYLAETIRTQDVSVVHFVPSMLAAFEDVLGDAMSDLTSLRLLFTSGEALSPAVADAALTRLRSVELHNLYGPTEAAVDVTAIRVRSRSSSVPIGVPVANTSALVLDSRLGLAPIGVPGELYLGGVQVARGYAAAGELTADRFVADPFGDPGARLYRTGDLVRWNAAGELEYLGRTDFQVKLRGQRVELGEIEAAVAAAPDVVHAAAAVATAPGGAEVLVGYVAPASVDLDAVKAHVDRVLPEYMRPTLWTVLEEIALSASGKIDRKSLPAPDFGALQTEYVAPDSEAEIAVAKVIGELLGVDRVSVTESFFDLGGNSLSAMRAVARAGQALGVELTVRDLFDAPTVRALVAASSGKRRALAPLTAIDPRPDRIPLSFAQQRMWFINQFDPTSGTYNIPLPLRLTGPLDLVALREAIVDVVVRHEVLRTTFPQVEGGPVQEIADAASAGDALDWAVVDAGADLIAAATQGFDVARERPLRVRVHRRADNDHAVLLVVHHIAGDGESLRPLATDVVTAYAARAGGEAPVFEPIEVQFADFAIWQHRTLGDPADPESVVSGQLEYWEKNLADLPDVLNLPSDRVRPAVASKLAGQTDFVLPAHTASAVRRIAHDTGVTDFMVLHAALAIFLARMSDTSDIAIGTPVAGRGRQELDALVGMFVNTLVLRTEVDPAETFQNFLGRVRDVDLAAYAHDSAPFEAVVDRLDPVRSEAFAPLTQILFSFFERRVDDTAFDLGDLRFEPIDIPESSARLDLTLTVQAADAGDWAGTLVYATDLFDPATAESMTERFVRLLDHLVGDPSQAVGDAAFITNAERELLAPVGGLSGTAPIVLPEIFAGAARRRPDHPAVVTADDTITYRELDEASNRLARHLLAGGVGAETHVALAIPRSVDLMIAIWAVAKAGGAYVPIDPEYPAERVAHMVADSGASVGLTVSAVEGLPDAVVAWTGLDSAEMAAALELLPSGPVTDAERGAPVRVDQTAYVIYTSGSTGRPKGVVVSHRGLANFGAEEIRRSDADADARALGFASPSFDASVLEYLMAFLTGGTLVYRSREAIGGQDLQAFMREHRVTHTFLTPTVMASLDPEGLPDLVTVYAGGEAVPAALTDRWAPVRRIQNLYGPTETTIGVCIGEPLRAGEPVTLGGPIDGVSLTVLDDRLHPVPEGVLGQLYIAGVGLSRGYLDRAGLTAERFVADPFGAPGSRMYRTGDVVRWVRDDRGELTVAYAGRSDDQVKLRGLRIELGEIEQVLAGHPSVASAVVLGLGADGTLAASGTSVVSGLAGYYVAEPGTAPTTAELRAHLLTDLPEYMVPSVLTALDTLPLTPVGKLDRKALPAPSLVVDENVVEPATESEATLAAIVAGLLGVPAVSVTESFFALGGDSIMSIQLASAARSAGMELSPREIFELRTVRAMARAVDVERVQLPMVEEPSGALVLTATPLTRWLADATSGADGDLSDFNQATVLSVDSGTRVSDVAVLMAALVRTHPALGARLDGEGGALSLVFGEPFDAEAAVGETVVDAAAGSTEFDAAILRAHATAAEGLDPAAGVQLRAQLLRGADRACLVVVAHHLAVDAVSWPILIEDLVTGWAQSSAGRPVELRAESTSFRAWFAALAERGVSESEAEFWEERAPRRRTPLTADTDEPVRWSATSAVDVTVPAEVTEALLTRTAGAFDGGVDDVLLAAFARAVRSWQQSRGIVDDEPVFVLTEGHGRYEDVLESGAHPRRADLSRTVGWFTSIAPTRLDPADDVVHAVKAAKEERLARPARGLGFSFLRYGAGAPLADRPLPSIAFNYLGGRGGTAQEAPADSAPMTPLPAGPRLPATVTGAVDTMSALTINAGVDSSPDGSVITAEFRYALESLDDDVVADLGVRWNAELAELVRVTDAGSPGLSPSQVPGAQVSQDDLDDLAAAYPGSDVWGLSPLQRGLYFQAMMAESAGVPDVYVVQAALRMRGIPDLDRLQGAAQHLVAVHPALRSAFVTTPGGSLVAAVPAEVQVPWTVVDLGAVTEDESAEYLRDLKKREALNRFDLTAAPLMRFTVVLHGESADVLVTAHHLVVDGWSLPLVLADLLALYTAGVTYTQREAGAADFKDYLFALDARDRGEGLEIWRQVLAPASGPTLVAPGAQADPEAMPAAVEVPLGTDLSERLEIAARANGVTVATVLQVAWAVFLSKVAGERVVTFGETVSGRPADLVGVESVVGLFINTLPVVVDVDPEAPLSELLSGLQRDKVAVLDHHHLGLPEIVAAAEGSIGFDTLVVHESYPVDEKALAHSGALGDVSIEEAVFTDATHYPLNLITSGDGQRLAASLRYLPAAFGADQVQGFAEMITRILETIADRPTAAVSDVSLLGESERERLAGLPVP
ncbi:MAG: amino acid adenylation domain-containing protein, partial [Gordonia sp. (in: high G+C Gram-positive bacteria)]